VLDLSLDVYPQYYGHSAAMSKKKLVDLPEERRHAKKAAKSLHIKRIEKRIL
jgi:hypothetical protein